MSDGNETPTPVEEVSAVVEQVSEEQAEQIRRMLVRNEKRAAKVAKRTAEDEAKTPEERAVAQATRFARDMRMLRKQGPGGRRLAFLISKGITQNAYRGLNVIQLAEVSAKSREFEYQLKQRRLEKDAKGILQEATDLNQAVQEVVDDLGS